MTVSIKNLGYGEGWGWYSLLKKRKVDPILIKGNPKIGDEICKNLDYKSGNTINFVISFAKEDNKTKEEAREITKEFMKEYMQGFDEDEYHLDIVEHSDTDNLHYHVRVPKINLLTGTQLKLYFHKSDLNYKKAVIDVIAEKHNLIIGLDNKKTIPNDTVERIEKWREDFNQKPFNFKTIKGRAEAEKEITNYISNLITSDAVSSLDDVKNELISLDFDVVNEGFDRNVGSDYLTILEPNGKKIKIKGQMYGEEFYKHDSEDKRERISSNRSTTERKRSDRPSRSEASAVLHKERTKRLRFISKQYENARKRARKKIQDAVEEYEKDSLDDNLTFDFDASARGNTSDLSSDESVKDDSNNRNRSEIISKFRSLRSRIEQFRVKEVAEAERRAEEESRRTRRRESAIEIENNRNVNINEKKKIMVNNNEELERFKKEINLAEYMSLLGYSRDEKKSTKHHTVMRNGSEKLVVSISKTSNDYIYFDAHDTNNNGSIINFVQSQKNVNLGQVRKILREHISNPVDNFEHKIVVNSTSTSTADVEKINNMWSKLAVEKFTEPYRNISADILNDANIRRVKDKIYFPLTNADGVVGIDSVNIKTNQKALITKSKKSIWKEGNLEDAKRILIFESVIDALSYRQMHGKENDYYVATIGTFGSVGEESLRDIFKNKNTATRIVLCTDNDTAGSKMALSIKKIAINTDASIKTIYRHKPTLNDFNDDLAEIEKSNKKTEKVKVEKKKKVYVHQAPGPKM